MQDINEIIAGFPMAMNQSCYAVKSKNRMSQYFVHLFTLSAISKLKNEAVGAVFGALVIKDFDEHSLIEPDKYTIDLFGKIMEPFGIIILNLIKQNQMLLELKELLRSNLTTEAR